MKNTFSFLDNIELSEVAPKQVGRTKRAESNPTSADLRVFPNGELYPSLELIDEFSLEYQEEGFEGLENGFDLIDSELWGMLPKGTPRFLAIATVSKDSLRKPMLFGKSRKKDGQPVHSVGAQGSTASGLLLLDYLDRVLDVSIGDLPYIDLQIVREHRIASNNGIYNLPYVQQKGEDSGTIKSVRREECEIFPLIPTSLNQETPVEEPSKEEIEVNED